MRFAAIGVVVCGVLAACGHGNGDSDSHSLGRVADARGRAASGNSDFAVGEAGGLEVLASLATGVNANANAYVVERDTAVIRGGTIVGRVAGPDDIAGDRVVTPHVESATCRPFTETIIPSDDRGVGNAVAWLVGVTHGPALNVPRRVTLTLDRCQLLPRVQLMAIGSSMLVKSRDAMTSALTFVEMGTLKTPRARVDFTDAGQVVPTDLIATTPGLIEVRDNMHPWVHAYVVVAPHPFVEVTSADGAFRFDAVPPGTYTLVVWQEALGVKTRAVRITTGVETRVVVQY